MKHSEDDQEKSVVKSRYWEVIAYPESMVDNYALLIPSIVQVPCVWILHNKDVLSDRYHSKFEAKRKDHLHIILAFDGPTTSSVVLRTINQLTKEDCANCAPVAIPVLSMKAAYKYLTHDTEAAKNAGKYKYNKKELHECNNFDIGLYVAVSAAQKQLKLREITNFILGSHCTNFYDLTLWAMQQDQKQGSEDCVYYDTLTSHSGFLERIMKGVYHHDNPDK